MIIASAPMTSLLVRLIIQARFLVRFFPIYIIPQTFELRRITDHLASQVPIALIPLREVTTGLDRKSTRLNPSHVATSYAVCCFKENSRGHEVLDALRR